VPVQRRIAQRAGEPRWLDIKALLPSQRCHDPNTGRTGRRRRRRRSCGSARPHRSVRTSALPYGSTIGAGRL